VWRILLITALLLGCGKPIKTVSQIEYPTLFTQYCLRGTIGSQNTLFLACTTDKARCEWGYNKAKKYGSLSGVKVVTECQATKVHIKVNGIVAER
jgi:hypothetical protein